MNPKGRILKTLWKHKLLLIIVVTICCQSVFFQKSAWGLAGTQPVLTGGFSTARSAPAQANEGELIKAVNLGNHELVRELLEQGIDVNGHQGDGATALHWATHRDDSETAELLIHANASVNVSDDHGVTPLSLACLNGSTRLVEMLLQAGANPNTARTSGETPLMTASRVGNLDVVKTLLLQGTDVTAREASRGQTALMLGGI